MPEIDPALVPLLALLLTVTAVVALVLVAARAQRRRLAALESLFEPGSARLGRLASGVEGRVRGYACRYAVQQRSQYSPGGALIRVGAVTPTTWSARTEGMISRALAGLGLTRDVELGDPELDRTLRFDAESVSDLLSALGTDAARAALRRLAASPGFQSVRVRRDRVELRWSPYHRERDLEPDSVRDRLGCALDLVLAAGYPPRVG